MQPQQYRRTISYRKPFLLLSKYAFSPTETSFCLQSLLGIGLTERAYSMHAASSLRHIKFADVFTAAVSSRRAPVSYVLLSPVARPSATICVSNGQPGRSEEHTSELQSLTNLVCRLLLEKKKN